MKTYLGDGAYAEIDDYGTITLTAEDGIAVNETIVLEPEAYDALERFVMEWRQAR